MYMMVLSSITIVYFASLYSFLTSEQRVPWTRPAVLTLETLHILTNLMFSKLEIRVKLTPQCVAFTNKGLRDRCRRGPATLVHVLHMSRTEQLLEAIFDYLTKSLNTSLKPCPFKAPSGVTPADVSLT